MFCPYNPTNIPWIPAAGIMVGEPWSSYPAPEDGCCDVPNQVVPFDVQGTPYTAPLHHTGTITPYGHHYTIHGTITPYSHHYTILAPLHHTRTTTHIALLHTQSYCIVKEGSTQLEWRRKQLTLTDLFSFLPTITTG